MCTTLGEAKNYYISFREASGRKPATLVKDVQCLSALVTAFGGDFPVGEITDIDSFFKNWDQSASYRNSHISVFRKFFEFCRKRGYIALSVDPMYGLEHAPLPPKDRKHIPVDQFAALLDAATEPRDRIICAIGLYCFCRQGEISTLRVQDYDPIELRLSVNVWKTNKFDRMQVNTELREELERWLRWYRKTCPGLAPTASLVPRTERTWGQWTYVPGSGLQRPYTAVQRAIRALGWEDDEVDGEGGHLLRRSGARAWYFALKHAGSERAMAAVQRRLHHATRAMTERYIGITAEDAELDEILLGKRMFASEQGVVVPLRSVG